MKKITFPSKVINLATVTVEIKKNLLFTAILFGVIQGFSQPVITSFSPSSGRVGSVVTIQGSNFNTDINSNVVVFGGVKAQVISGSSSSLTVLVPVGAATQNITVTDIVNGLTASSIKTFRPTSGCDGGAFNPNSFSNIVNFGSEIFNQITSADFDGDGKLDLVVTKEGLYPELSIFLNTSSNGQVTFATKIIIATGTDTGPDYWGQISIGDIDGDGKQDIIVPNTIQIGINISSSVSVFRNISTVGSISFASKVDLLSGINSVGCVIGDLDGDGRPEIVCSNIGTFWDDSNGKTFVNGGSVSIFKNNSSIGNISFDPRMDYSSATSPWNIALTDIDGDGKVDIASTNRVINSNLSGSWSVSIFRNITSSAISFDNRVDISLGVMAGNIIFGDLDDDGMDDMIIQSDKIHIYKNNSSYGNISFTTGPSYSINGTGSGFHLLNAIALNDFTGDGKLDIMCSSRTGSLFALFQNLSNGNISFNEKMDYFTGGWSNYFVIADIDGDGKSDIVNINSDFTSSSGEISIFKNKINEQPNINTINPNTGPQGTAVIIKGYGFSEIADSNHVYFNDTILAEITSASCNSLTVIVPTNSSNAPIKVVRNNAVSLSDQYYLYPLITNSNVPAINTFAPISGGIGDIILISGSNFSSNPSDNIVFFGSVKAPVINASSSSLQVIVPPGSTYAPISVTTNRQTAYSTLSFVVTFPLTDTAFVSNSFARLDFPGQYLNYNAFESKCFEDIDGDGKPDLVLHMTLQNELSILKNTSLGGVISFSNPITYSLSGQISQGQEYYQFTGHDIIATDLDGDGKKDILIANGDKNNISIFKNRSTINNLCFNQRKDINTAQDVCKISTGDLDGDGKPDVVLSYLNQNFISILKNSTINGIISFDSTQDISSSSYMTSISDIDGDGKPELLTYNANNTKYLSL